MQDQPSDDREQIRRELSPPFVLVSVTNERREKIVCGILGDRGFTGEAKGETVDRSTPAIIEFTERPGITIERQPENIDVGPLVGLLVHYSYYLSTIAGIFRRWFIPGNNLIWKDTQDCTLGWFAPPLRGGS